MEDLADRIERLKAAKLTAQQIQIIELLEEGLTYEAIGKRLSLVKVTIQYHVTNIYLKLDIHHLPKAQRQRELGKFAMVLKHLPQQINLPKDPEERSARPEPEVISDEPSPQALAIIQAVVAALEDERGLVLWKKPDVDIQPTTLPSQFPPTFPSHRRKLLPLRPWVMLLATFVLGISAGAVITSLLAGATASSSSSPRSAPSSPTAAPATSSICGESLLITAPPMPRLIRSEGVSAFTMDNTKVDDSKSGVLNNKVRALAVDSRGVWLGYYIRDDNPRNGIGYFNSVESWADCSVSVLEPEVNPTVDVRMNTPAGATATAAALVTATNNINAIAVDEKSNRVWAATEKGGVLMFDDKEWHRYTTEDDLPSNEIFGIALDAENNPWVGTLKGIAGFDGSRWSLHYTMQGGDLTDNAVHAIAFSSNRDMWVGHIGAGVSRLRSSDRSWSHYKASEGKLGGDQVRGIAVRSAITETNTPESIWFATDGGGVSRFEREEWEVYRIEQGLPSNEVQAVAVDKYNRVWAATLGGVAYFDGTKWTQYNSLKTLSIAFGPPCQDCPQGYDFNDESTLNDNSVWTGTDENGLTHSRIPYPSEAVTVTSAIYPEVVAPGETFPISITVTPLQPYRLSNKWGDFLLNIDKSDDLLFGAHENVTVLKTVAPGQPYTFIYETHPFTMTAPLLPEGVDEKPFTSTWRVWTHNRFAGPPIPITFTVKRLQATPSPNPTP